MNMPSGVVTFVFSDIEGSTRLWEADPSGMARSLARHDEIVRTAVEATGGVVFKHTGDGFGAAFESVSAALDAAVAVADSLTSEAWDGPSLSVRIGLHSGEAEPREGDYFGATVTRTARLMDAGNGGQILVSEAARRLVANRPPSGATFVDAGEHRLKDLGEPVHISRLVTSGASDERELRTLERAPHNLPVQLSSFVGRETQIKELADLVRHSRLVTLTGIGGVGKTRLSLQIAADLLSEFAHGAWFVELAPLAESGLLADTVANAASVPQDSNSPAERRLLRFLADRRALIVLDNCEHLIDDVAAFVDTLLRSCPDVHVLATSREGLSVSGEVLWRVPSLRVDDDAAAVELFAERARLVQPGFTVTDKNLATVAELCTRLDGIPLAIELATARLKMMSVEQIAQHLNDRFRLLTGGSRTAVERQRTLRAMMDWSYDLLSPAEQALLRRLSVFYDGFTYEAAEEVCSGEQLARFEVLDLLGRLVEASVVTFENDPRPRYRLLETVRQYSLDRLFEAGEADEARRRHAEYFRATSKSVSDALDRDDYTAMDLATDDLGNYRAAMTWALESEHGELALEIACHLRMYFWNRVMYRESQKWILSALAVVADDESPYVPVGAAYALTDASNLADANTKEALLPRVHRLLGTDLEPISRGLLSNALAAHTIDRDAAEGDKLFREAHNLLRSAGSPRWASAVQNRFLTAWSMNSREFEEEVLELVDAAVAEGVSIHDAVVRMAFAVLAEDYDRVLEFTGRRTPIDEWEEAMLLNFRALAERATGKLDEATESLRRVETVLGASVPGHHDWQIAMLWIQKDELAQAVETVRSTRQEKADAMSAVERMHAALFWSVVAQLRGDHATSAVLAGFVEWLRDTASVRPLDFEQRLVAPAHESARDTLGEDAYEAEQRRGYETAWEDLPLVHD